jgi:hypothetical protein
VHESCATFTISHPHPNESPHVDSGAASLVTKSLGLEQTTMASLL